MLLACIPALTIGLLALTARRTSDAGVGNAQVNWAQDISLVSQFLSTAISRSGQDLANAATSALASENDKLIHNGIVDSLPLDVANTDPNIVAADNVLGFQGIFRYLVTGLTNLMTNGTSYGPYV